MPLALMNLWLVCCATLFGEAQDANPSASTEVRLLMDILEAKPVSTVMVKEPSGGHSGLGGGFEIGSPRWH